MGTIGYAGTTEEKLFGIPAECNPRAVLYAAAMDNYEPAPRNTEYGKLVEYDRDDEVTGQPCYMRSTGRSTIPAGSIFIIDDGLTARPYYGGGYSEGKPSLLYPEGREPIEILIPFPVNPEGRTRPDNGEVIDFANWFLGPRKAYLLKITREPLPKRVPFSSLNDLIVTDDDNDDLAPTCRNGCPDGALGRHKFSCDWAGGSWYLDGTMVMILGDSPDSDMVCVKRPGFDESHQHVDASRLERRGVR